MNLRLSRDRQTGHDVLVQARHSYQERTLWYLMIFAFLTGRSSTELHLDSAASVQQLIRLEQRDVDHVVNVEATNLSRQSARLLKLVSDFAQ